MTNARSSSFTQANFMSYFTFIVIPLGLPILLCAWTPYSTKVTAYITHRRRRIYFLHNTIQNNFYKCVERMALKDCRIEVYIRIVTRMRLKKLTDYHWFTPNNNFAKVSCPNIKIVSISAYVIWLWLSNIIKVQTQILLDTFKNMSKDSTKVAQYAMSS